MFNKAGLWGALGFSLALSACQGGTPLAAGAPAAAEAVATEAPLAWGPTRALVAGGASAAGEQAPLLGLNAPLPRRALQQAAGPQMWGFMFQRTWQREETVVRVEPPSPKYHWLSGEIIGWWPEARYTSKVLVNGADFLAPGLSQVAYLSDNRFLLRVPADKVWVVTQVVRPERITLNGIALASAREGDSANYAKMEVVERPTLVRILAGPGQQVAISAGMGASMQGYLDDPATYGNAFGAGAKYTQ